MKILAIETSCDETALALLEASGDLVKPNFKILKTALYSQVEKHREFGGVFPSLAKREHAKNLVPLLEELLSDNIKLGNTTIPEDETQKILEREQDLAEALIDFTSKHDAPNIDLITVTSGPGLEPALWVGINFARALSLIWNIPVMPTNHMEGHIVSVLTETEHVDFPALALLISGGHTELVLIKSWGEYKVIGKTKDDAVGEAYDKVARMIDLPYPGGPQISKLAKDFRDRNNKQATSASSRFTLPRPMLNTKDYDFSFSGLKTAVLYGLQKIEKIDDGIKMEIAGEFEQAITDVLIKKTQKALKDLGAKSLIVGGGVIANNYIRENLKKLGDELGIQTFFPTHELSTDNAVMIGIAGYLKSLTEPATVNPEIKAKGNLTF